MYNGQPITGPSALGGGGGATRSAREANEAQEKSDAQKLAEHEAQQAAKVAALEAADDDTIHRGLVESVRDAKVKRGISRDDEEDELGDDELFDQLERELDQEQGPGSLRERRMEQLREELESLQAQRVQKSHGRLTEASTEKELIKQLSENANVVVHFYKTDFQRCRIMDKHLEFLAPLHPKTLFLKISVLQAPFLVTKLDIRTLPCLVCFKEGGKVKDKVVGFEELGNTDSFGSGVLEWRLGRAGVLTPRSEQNANRPIMGFAAKKADVDDDDWD